MRLLEYKENKIRGSFDFPVEAYYIDERHPRYVMPMHWHEEHEIIKIVKGKFHYEIGTEKGVAAAGDILYVNSGVLHAGIPEECEYCCVVFDLGFLIKSNTAIGKILAPFINGDLAVSLRLPDDNGQTGLIIQRLSDILLGNTKGNELQAQGSLLLLFGDIMQNCYYVSRTDGTPAKKSLSQLKRALSVIENSYSAPITLETLAREAGMNPKYFCYFFKRMTHLSPMEYLNRYRVEVACYRLMSGWRNITDLAYACGFNDLSYFIRVFKRIVGVTPKQYGALKPEIRDPAI